MQEVSIKNLVPGKEYYMECIERMERKFLPPYKMIATFERLEPNNIFPEAIFICVSNFRKIKYKNNKNFGYDARSCHGWKYYEIVEHQIQKNMERRAYNMVLQRIINDEYFRPIDVI
jgi:hypothetical protein